VSPRSAVAAMTAGVACRSCGTGLRENAKFCDDCGAPTAVSRGTAEYKQVTVLFADVVHSMEIAARESRSRTTPHPAARRSATRRIGHHGARSTPPPARRRCATTSETHRSSPTSPHPRPARRVPGTATTTPAPARRTSPYSARPAGPEDIPDNPPPGPPADDPSRAPSRCGPRPQAAPAAAPDNMARPIV
jgi:hypothetical protein